MRILAIESSCDETGASVVEKTEANSITVLSNVIATSSDMHALTGGIIPESAAREQVKSIIPVIVQALLKSQNIVPINSEADFTQANEIMKSDIDQIAITYGPGLIGSLLVGVETAKTLSFTLKKPIIPVNHLLAHIYANFIHNIQPRTPIFPFIGLIVSGGHTDLLHFRSHNEYKWLGGTRDDAAGEAIDKIGRMIDLPYPAGPEMEKRAKTIKESNFKFQSPMINSKDYDFSFSGLKAETMRFIKNNEINDLIKNEICFSTQKAIFDVLIKKTIKAAEEFNCKNILLGGGVSANKTLIEQFNLSIHNSQPSISIFAPLKEYATDNAAMIGTYAIMNGKPIPWEKVKSNPELYFA